MSSEWTSEKVGIQQLQTKLPLTTANSPFIANTPLPWEVTVTRTPLGPPTNSLGTEKCRRIPLDPSLPLISARLIEQTQRLRSGKIMGGVAHAKERLYLVGRKDEDRFWDALCEAARISAKVDPDKQLCYGLISESARRCRY